MTPQCEAWTHMGRACWTHAQTPGAWCPPRHTHTPVHTHTEPFTGLPPGFLVLSRLIPAGLSCAFILPDSQNSAKDEFGHTNLHTSCQAKALLEDEVMSVGNLRRRRGPLQMGTGPRDCAKVTALCGCAFGHPGKVGLGSFIAAAHHEGSSSSTCSSRTR